MIKIKMVGQQDVTCMGERPNQHKISQETLKVKHNLGDLRIDGRIMFTWILKACVRL
jgi:hypothetical protein